jgi:TM2 domain-containing membrane protein YozV
MIHRIRVDEPLPQKRNYDANFALSMSISLALFAGIHGFHRFYVGDILVGLAQCFTCGGCCIWSIVDWANIEKIIEKANQRRQWTSQSQPQPSAGKVWFAPRTLNS